MPRELARHLLIRQYELEGRIHRIEHSALFRALRWIGERTGYANVLRARDGGETDYNAWLEQMGWTEPSTQQCAERIASWHRPLQVSYLVGSSGAAESVSGQPVAPVEVLAFDDRESFQKAVCQARGEFSAVLPADVRLSPLTAFRWGALLQDADCDVIYSDWDHTASDGRRHAPRFTPEFSPELLLRHAYWGGCFAVRTRLLKELIAGIDPTATDWRHSLAVRVAKATKSVARIPAILWHSENSPDGAATAFDAGADRGEAGDASIVICSRTPSLLQRCLRALRQSDAAKAEIVVVAHESGAATKLGRIASAHGARTATYSGKFHYGVMNALGVDHSSRPNVVLLNDDVEPIAPDWLGALLGPLRKKEIAVTGGVLLYPGGTVQHAGVIIGGWPSPAHIGRRQRSSPWWPWLRHTREVSAVTGACLAIRRGVWDELGGFDRRFPVNYNDVDLCLRARRAGYSVVLAGEAVLCHREAQTRDAIVTPAEGFLFSSQWPNALVSSDPFFNPNLTLRHERIALAQRPTI